MVVVVGTNGEVVSVVETAKMKLVCRRRGRTWVGRDINNFIKIDRVHNRSLSVRPLTENLY